MASFIKPHSRWSQVWRAYLFIGALLLVAVSLVYTVGLIKRLESEPRIMSRVFARFCMTAALPEPAGESPETGIIFEEVIQNINFPVVVTDLHGLPIAWRNIDTKGTEFDQQVIPPDVAERWDELLPEEPFYRLKQAIGELDHQNQPITMTLGQDTSNVVTVHYGQPRVLRELRFIPIIQLVVVALFVWIGFIGFRTIKINEERAVWVGLAKEAAHQLGTPISSLMGWLALLKEGGHPATDVVPEMEKDLSHLNRVLARFNQIGSIPKLVPVEVTKLTSESVDYFKRRVANMGKEIAFEENYQQTCEVALNPELFLWAVENLIKNAIDAIEGPGGLIKVKVVRNGQKLEITVEDNGRGINPKNQAKIFRPGFTTKTVGWGLGLSLVKRIIEDYHGGRIKLLSSRPGAGTAFLINLPLPPKSKTL
jgi:NtrC-family two-component system sensor histidine kinase KinB